MSALPPGDLADASLEELLRHLVHPRDVEPLVKAGVCLRDLARPGLEGAGSLLPLRPSTRRRLEAAFELMRRRQREECSRTGPVRGAADIVRLVGPSLRDEPVEVFRVVLLDARNRVLAAPEISRGTLGTSLVHPREVFRPALLARAAGVVAMHNHPSGDPVPSIEDDAVTRRLARAGAVLGIPLLDHVIVGEGRYDSYRDRGDLALVIAGNGDQGS